MDQFPHVPVLVEETIQGLLNGRVEIFVDATLGCGGHSEAVLTRFEKVRIVGFDVDEDELKIAKERLRQFGERITFVRENYRYIDRVLRDIGIQEVDAVLFDLGISSYQLVSKRGFSFYEDEFIDMRMDKRQPVTGFYVVNKYPFSRLKDIIQRYGEEKEAFRIARAIVERRKLREISTSKELAEIIEKAKRKKAKIHPATLTFQAIRIEVNGEIENLGEGLKNATKVLKKGGRIGVISFHSIEDRIVKTFFKNESCLRVVTKKPIMPQKEEVLNNPRSRSAKLRIAEKT